jgi:hypothetical protein
MSQNPFTFAAADDLRRPRVVNRVALRADSSRSVTLGLNDVMRICLKAALLGRQVAHAVPQSRSGFTALSTNELGTKGMRCAIGEEDHAARRLLRRGLRERQRDSAVTRFTGNKTPRKLGNPGEACAWPPLGRQWVQRQTAEWTSPTFPSPCSGSLRAPISAGVCRFLQRFWLVPRGVGAAALNLQSRRADRSSGPEFACDIVTA